MVPPRGRLQESRVGQREIRVCRHGHACDRFISLFASLKVQCTQLPVAAAANAASIATIVASKLPRTDEIRHAMPMKTGARQATTRTFFFLSRVTMSYFQNMSTSFARLVGSVAREGGHRRLPSRPLTARHG